MVPATSSPADSPLSPQLLLENLSLSDHHTATPRPINQLSQDSALYKDLDNRDALSATVMAFLLIHAPKSSEEPLKGIFTQTERIAKSCHMDPSKFVTAVCEILGLASVIVHHQMQRVLEVRDTFWEDMLETQKTMTEKMYNPRRDDSEEMHRHFDRPYDECYDGVLSTYHLTILREMAYYNRTIELSKALARRDPPAGELKGDLSSWFIKEQEQEIKLSRPRYLLWYSMPASEKIAKLVQMREFIVRLNGLREAEGECSTQNSISRRAQCSGTHTWSNFRRMAGLQEILVTEQEVWQTYVDDREEDRAAGRRTGNPASSGFPSSRSYAALGPCDAPQTPCEEDLKDEEKYPPEVCAVSRPRRRRRNRT